VESQVGHANYSSTTYPTLAIIENGDIAFDERDLSQEYWFKRSSDTFQSVLNIPKTLENDNGEVKDQHCLSKRLMVDNFITEEECADLMELGRPALTSQQVGDELSGANWMDIQRVFVENSERNRHLDTWKRTRVRLLNMVRTHFNVSELYADYSHLTSRTAGASSYSHGIHADNCGYNFDTGDCEVSEKHCCSWRSHSLLLYLNDGGGKDFEGGEFMFAKQRDDQHDGCAANFLVQPKCGHVVAFTSGPENMHAVTRVLSGTRWAFALWMTEELSRRERVYI